MKVVLCIVCVVFLSSCKNATASSSSGKDVTNLYQSSIVTSIDMSLLEQHGIRMKYRKVSISDFSAIEKAKYSREIDQEVGKEYLDAYAHGFIVLRNGGIIVNCMDQNSSVLLIISSQKRIVNKKTIPFRASNLLALEGGHIAAVSMGAIQILDANLNNISDVMQFHDDKSNPPFLFQDEEQSLIRIGRKIFKIRLLAKKPEDLGFYDAYDGNNKEKWRKITWDPSYLRVRKDTSVFDNHLIGSSAFDSNRYCIGTDLQGNSYYCNAEVINNEMTFVTNATMPVTFIVIKNEKEQLNKLIIAEKATHDLINVLGGKSFFIDSVSGGIYVMTVLREKILIELFTKKL